MMAGTLRRITGLAAVAAAAVTLTASSGAAVSATVKSATVGSLGTVVVSASGRTLYHDEHEKKNGAIACSGACATEWPPLLVPAGSKPVAGSGLKSSLLGTIKRSGKLQVTYDGYPLYLFAGDTKAGEANGQGVGSIWYALSPSGSVVTKSLTSSVAGTASSGSGSSSSSTGSSSPSSSSGSSSSSSSSPSSSSPSSSSSSSSSSGSSSSSPSGSTSSGSSTGGATTTTGTSTSLTDCSANPGAYGCM